MYLDACVLATPLFVSATHNRLVSALNIEGGYQISLLSTASLTNHNSLSILGVLDLGQVASIPDVEQLRNLIIAYKFVCYVILCILLLITAYLLVRRSSGEVLGSEQ